MTEGEQLHIYVTVRHDIKKLLCEVVNMRDGRAMVVTKRGRYYFLGGKAPDAWLTFRDAQVAAYNKMQRMARKHNELALAYAAAANVLMSAQEPV